MTFDLEKARASITRYHIENPDDVDTTTSALKDLVDQANLAEEMLAEIERLRADNAGLSKAVIDISQERDLAQAEFRTYHRAWEEQAARIQELEDALVEQSTVVDFLQEAWGSTIQLRAAKAQMKEWERLPEDFKEDWRKGVRKKLRAEGKIGSDASKPRSWQITDARKAALLRAYDVVSWVDRVDNDNERYITAILGMIKEAEQ